MKIDETKQPGIRVKRIFLKSLHFKLNDNFKREKPLKYSLGVDFEHSLSPDNKILVANLKVDCMKGVENPPFELVVNLVGIFEQTAQPNIALDDYAKEMASGLLMPFAREVIANITSRIPLPPLLLPPINIRALINKQSVLIDQVREKADNKYNNPDK